MANTVLKIGIAASLVGIAIFAIKKARDYVNTFGLEVIKYGIPRISNSVVYLPVVVRFNNPTPVPLNIDRVMADVYLLNGGKYQKVGQVTQPLSIPKGKSDQVLTAALDLKSVFNSNILNLATSILTAKSIVIRTDISAVYAGVTLPTQTLENKIDVDLQQLTGISGLGLAASHRREIKNGLEFNKYFDLAKVKGDEITLMKDGSVYETLDQMAKIADSTTDQTKLIARKLKGATLEKSLSNLWNFLYHHVQYKKDHPLREQLRTPLRTWKDRAIGVDCDCYSIFIRSVLNNWKVPSQFRMAGYKGDFQHVYVVVPKNLQAV